MDWDSSRPEDHQATLILVKLCGSNELDCVNLDFTRLLTRLKRLQNVSLQEHTFRCIRPKFVTSVDLDSVQWGEMQAHRRVLGLICVAFVSCNEERVLRSSTSSDSVVDLQNNRSPLKQCSDIDKMTTLMNQFAQMRGEWGSSVVDSRYLVFGSDKMNHLRTLVDHSFKGRFNERELITYTGGTQASRLETDVCEYLRAVLTVLHSKSMDSSFEKMEIPQCPSVPAEGRDRVGLENKNSKPYKKKCLGRLRKQAADYTLLTGVPGAAVGMYETAIESLKGCNDWLWLAAAYEGWGCAVVVGKYRFGMEHKPSLQRVATFASKTELESSQPKSFLKTHLRGASGAHALVDEVSMIVQGYDWNACKVNLIVTKFKAALENYEKFSFAAKIEFDCVFNTATVFRRENMFCDYEGFLRENMSKYLDVNFTQFSNGYKSQICLMLGTIFKDINFKRKQSFYLRLAALFKSSEKMSSADYAQMFPWLYQAVLGYGVRENARDLPMGYSKGWAYVQKWGLRELWSSSQRAQYNEATIRLMLYNLQGYIDHMNCEELHDLYTAIIETSRATCPDGLHTAWSRVRLPSDIIIPPIPLFNIPRVLSFEVLALPGPLAPTRVKRQEPAIFLYNPYEKVEKNIVRWVVDCACAVSISIQNTLPFELQIADLRLQIEKQGKRCEETVNSSPVKVLLPPSPSDPVQVQLVTQPNTHGKLSIAGYTYECMNVRNLVRLNDIPWMRDWFSNESKCIQVEVLPSLPYLQLDSSLHRSATEVNEDCNEVLAVETTIFSGQSFDHSIELENISKCDAIKSISFKILQPKICGGQNLISSIGEDDEVESNKSAEIEFQGSPWRFASKPLGPAESRHIRLRLFGVDPNSVQEGTDLIGSGTTREEGVGAAVGNMERIPYSGRLLRASITFEYEGGSESEGGVYSRTSVMVIFVTIVPAVTVAQWQLLSGDSARNRYLILDVTNSTQFEADLHFGDGKSISVESAEECRVPLLCPCCDAVPSLPLPCDRPLVMQIEEAQRLRVTVQKHVEKHVNVKWNIPSENLSGQVPVGNLLASDFLMKQLVLPVLSIGLSVNGEACHGKEEVTVGVGEMTPILVKMMNSTADRHFSGCASLSCRQDLQCSLPPLDRMDHVITVGPVLEPFTLSPANKPGISIDDITEHRTNDEASQIDMEFNLIFCYEGAYKVTPEYIFDAMCSDLDACDLFIPTITFNVISKTP